MAASRDTTAEHIKPLQGAIVRKYTAGATVAAGELVQKNGDASEVIPAVATAVILAPVGVAIQAAAENERLDVVVYGPVLCLSGATVGGLIYGTNTDGEPGESGGTHTYHTVFGYAETATILFVQPQVISFS